MPNFELWHSYRRWVVCKLLATARGWHRSLRAVVTTWTEFHAVYWEVHLHDSRLMTHEIKNGNNCFKDSTTALFPRSCVCYLRSDTSLFVRVYRKEAGSQSIHSFILHVNTDTCFGYTNVANIRMDTETWIRKL